MDEIADGITILKRYGQFKTACWVLHNNGEAAVVEMPPFLQKEKPPDKKAETFIKKNKLHLKYCMISHPHWDHCHSMPRFRNRFPQAEFVGHSSFLDDSYFRFVMRNLAFKRGHGFIHGGRMLFDYFIEGDFWTGYVGGEPLHVIYAPKHSYGDLMIIYKGAMITGDWFIGDLKDCNGLVKSRDKIISIDRVIKKVRQLNYHVHMLFSAHGDCLFYEADFYSVMEQCKIDHNGSHPNIKATLVPGGRKKAKRR